MIFERSYLIYILHTVHAHTHTHIYIYNIQIIQIRICHGLRLIRSHWSAEVKRVGEIHGVGLEFALAAFVPFSFRFSCVEPRAPVLTCAEWGSPKTPNMSCSQGLLLFELLGNRCDRSSRTADFRGGCPRFLLWLWQQKSPVVLGRCQPP